MHLGVQKFSGGYTQTLPRGKEGGCGKGEGRGKLNVPPHFSYRGYASVANAILLMSSQGYHETTFFIYCRHNERSRVLSCLIMSNLIPVN